MNTAVILAAGLGTRMKSALPKAAHQIGGRPMLAHLLATCEEVFDRIAVVIGPDMPQLAALVSRHACVVQAERLGTGHAALQAAPHFGAGDVTILYADNPLIRPQTLHALLAGRARGDLALMTMRPADPGQYGRVVIEDGQVVRIVEWKDANEAERANPLCNAGAMCAHGAHMAGWLRALRPDNAAGEYYLTDMVGLATAQRRRVVAVEGEASELRGINSRAELAQAEAVLQDRMREHALDGGATMTAPDTVFFSFDTRLAPDTVVEPHVVFGPGVVVEGAHIRAFSHLQGAHVGPGAVIGPYARLRPGTVVEAGAHVGNFVELKATRLGAGAKANHLSYLGDAAVGAGANIGAGTITCNYDGVAKHRTTIGAGAFVGSDAVLVAPVRVGDGAFVAAGSVITENVAADALAFGRSRQKSLPGGAARLRARLHKEKI